MGLSAGSYRSFVIRVWSRAGCLVHGQLTDLGSHKTAYFRDPRRLLALIFSHHGSPPEAARDGPRTGATSATGAAAAAAGTEDT